MPLLSNTPCSPEQLLTAAGLNVVLNTTANLNNTTAIPLPSSRRAAAIARLHDHDFYLNCDPHITGYSTVPAPTPEPSYASYKVPDTVTATEETVKLYDVNDHVPNPVYSSNITSRQEIVDTADGLWVRIRSPMGVVMETTWTVREKQGEDALELVEEVKIACSRLLIGLVKSSIEDNWVKIHEKIVGSMVEDAKTA